MLSTLHSHRQALDPAEVARQKVRIRSLRMSAKSYLGMFFLVASIGFLDAVPARVVVEYGVLIAVILSAFYVVFKNNHNLRFADPSLTMLQACSAFGPTLWVMVWVDGVAPRAALLVVSTLPALYATLALDTRQFQRLATFYVGTYAALLMILWVRDPRQIDVTPELIMLLAFAMVMYQFAVVGGFTSGLREALRRRNEEINELANRDALTGVHNRRHLYTFLGEEMARADRGQLDLSICMFDIDHFKQVNDVHGHQAGDDILRKVAQTAADSVRNIDCCARYGGEEFVLVLAQTPLEGAKNAAERLRALISELEFPEIANGEIQLTVSIGCAEYIPGEAQASIIARADSALYVAKNGGRNRVATEAKESSAQPEH